MSTTTAAPVPYLNPAFDPTPPKQPLPKPAQPASTQTASTQHAPTRPEPETQATKPVALKTKPAQPASPRTANPAHALGRRGEDLVAKYVESRGLILLCRNWRCREGEIDILATDGHMVVICEVKTRTTDEYGTPADAMSAKKIRCIKAATNRWLREYRVPYVPVRYDLAEVWWPPKGKPHLQYRRDAF